jgi:hypothetical protein
MLEATIRLRCALKSFTIGGLELGESETRLVTHLVHGDATRLSRSGTRLPPACIYHHGYLQSDSSWHQHSAWLL